MEEVSDELGEGHARELRLADIEDANERLQRGSVGRLMYDPVVPEETLTPIVEACTDTGHWPFLTFVEGYLRPVLQTETQRLIGTQAIVAYIKSQA